MVADELRRQADQFIDIADLEQLICRDPAQQRPVRETREPREPRSYAPRGTPVREPLQDRDVSEDVGR